MGNLQEKPTKGILLRILSGALFAGMLVCIKAVSDEVPVGQLVFYRSLFALLPIVVFLLLRREFPQGLASLMRFNGLIAQRCNCYCN